MDTIVSRLGKEIIIGNDRPTVLIGERINPTGKKKLAAALKDRDMEIIRQEAISQVEAGADILDVNVGLPGIDEVALLPEVVKVVMEAVEVPLCLDSSNPKALEAALRVYQGKALLNSVNGEERTLNQVLPLVKEYGTVVIGLTMDEEGISNDPQKRVAVAIRSSKELKPLVYLVKILLLTALPWLWEQTAMPGELQLIQSARLRLS